MGVDSFINEIVPFVTSSNKKVVVLGIVSKKLLERLADFGYQVLNIHDVEEFDSVNNTDFSAAISCDLFTNCEDALVKICLEKVLNCLQVGGTFAFCETCFEEADNEGLYIRKPSFYSSYVESVTLTSNVNGLIYQNIFEITLSKVLKPSNKVLWVVTKVKSSRDESFGFGSFQEFLNTKQYSLTGILRYEKIFGEGFISTGGIDTTREFVGYLKLKSGEHILDVGSGIGGGDFYMAENFGVKVTGVDLSSNVVAIALDRWREKECPNISFEVCDATKRNFPESTFDVIYSRDTILHISDKRHLFSSFLKWLKPGGRLLISDYCCCDGQWSEDYTLYVKQRGYFLLSVKDYGKLLGDVGFVKVKAEDRTDQFVEMLKKELDRITMTRKAFLKDFTEEDFNALLSGW